MNNKVFDNERLFNLYSNNSLVDLNYRCNNWDKSFFVLTLHAKPFLRLFYGKTGFRVWWEDSF